MRQPSFLPEQIPTEPKALAIYLAEQLRTIYSRTHLLEESFQHKQYAAPDKPRDGMIRWADGSDWNPGFGPGLYQYINDAWVPMFSTPVFNVKAFGAKGDTAQALASISAGSKTVTQKSWAGTVTDATNTEPIEVTLTPAHNLYSGGGLTVSGVVGNTKANGTFRVGYRGATKLALVPTKGNGAYISGGTYLAVRSPFSIDDVGKVITIPGAGPAGAVLAGTITAFISQTQVEIDTAASVGVTDAEITWGTDDSDAIQRVFDYADAFRNQDLTNYGGVTINFPQGCYLVSRTLVCNLDRIHLLGEGASHTTLLLKAGVTLAAAALLPCPAFAWGYFAPGFGQELVKYGILNTDRNAAHYNWSIRQMSFIGNGQDGSTNNNGLCLYGMQQNGIIEDVNASRFGGHCIYFGYTDNTFSPETSLITLRNVWTIFGGETLIQCTHEGFIRYEQVHAERSIRGDGIHSNGIFDSCHLEFTRYGIRPEVQPAGAGGTVYEGVAIHCTGYAHDWATVQALGQCGEPIAMIYTIRGVDMIGCVSTGYKLLLLFDDGTERNEYSEYTPIPPIARQSHQATIFHQSFLLARRLEVGSFNKEMWGSPSDVTLDIYPPAVGGGSNVYLRLIHPDWKSQFKMQKNVFGFVNALLLEPQIGADCAFVISMSGAATYQFINNLFKCLNPSEFLANMQIADVISNPNVVMQNAVNFSGADQGGFRSINSKFTGFPNWAKTSSAGSTTAMFIREAVQRWQLRFGAATNAQGTDPGDDYFTVTDGGYCYVGPKSLSVGLNRTLLVADRVGASCRSSFYATSGQSVPVLEVCDESGVVVHKFEGTSGNAKYTLAAGGGSGAVVTVGVGGNSAKATFAEGGNIVTIDPVLGFIDVAGAGATNYELRMNGTRVVTLQKAAVTNTTKTAGAAYTANEQNMLNEIKAALGDLIAKLGATSGHGLIAN